MANLLTITKQPNDYFSFILNGDVLSEINNIRNDMTAIGDICHFKTANGANLIKEQDVFYFNVTIVNGMSTLIPVSVDDLFAKLISVNFFGWINGFGGGGGVNRFDELEDTFQYFGKDGQGLRVNESQLKLEPYVLPNTSYLNLFPSPLLPNKMLRVNPAGTSYEFVDASETVGSKIVAYDFPRLTVPRQGFVIPIGKKAIKVEVNGANYNIETANNILEPNTFSQSGSTVVIKEPLEIGNYIIIYTQ